MMWGFGGHGKKRGLRVWILHILARGPKNGAEIMDSMESMSQGWWRPSPGSVYPSLEELTREGLLRRLEDGRYELTPQGKDDTAWSSGWFSGRPRGAHEAVEEVASLVAYLEDLSSGSRPTVTAEKERLRELSQRLSSLAK